MKRLFLFTAIVFTVIVEGQVMNFKFKNIENSPKKIIVKYGVSKLNSEIGTANISYKTNIYKLNQDGTFENKKTYRKDGKLSNFIIYTYNENELLKSATYRNGDSSLNYISNYYYDDQKKLIQNLFFTLSDTTAIDFKYEKKPNVLVRHKLHRNSGDSSLVFLDKKGNEIKSIYTKKGKMNGGLEKTYDFHGNLLSSYKFDKYGNIIVISEFTYDERGNYLTHKTFSYKNGKKTLIGETNQTIKYDKFNNPIEKISKNLNSGFVYIEKYQYFYN